MNLSPEAARIVESLYKEDADVKTLKVTTDVEDDGKELAMVQFRPRTQRGFGFTANIVPGDDKEKERVLGEALTALREGIDAFIEDFIKKNTKE